MEKQSDLILLDLFSGTGGFHKGLLEAGFSFKETYYSDIDKHAIANYKYNFPNAKSIGSVENILQSGINRPNIITFGSPCFLEGTKVLSTRGFVDISRIEVGDKVLTHKGRWKNVSHINEKEHNGDIHTIMLGKDTEPIMCTSEHPFYVVDKEIIYNSKLRSYDVIWSNPYWIEAKYLSSKHHVVVSNQKEDYKLDISEDEAYLFGYYLAEGWLDKTVRKRDNKRMYRIFFAMHENKEQHFRDIVSRISYKGRFVNKKHISVCISHKYEGKAIKATISNKNLFTLFELAGSTSMLKVVPGVILSAPVNIQKKFLDGYMYGDGSYNKEAKSYTATSKNIEMAYGLRHLVRRVYNEIPTIFYTKVKPTTVINGRVVNQNPYYSIRWILDKEKEVFSYRVKNEIVVKVVKNEKEQTIKSVFNLTVEGDNTYTVGNYVVHNCQDFSIAGNRAGLDGARSGLITQAIAAVSHFRPDIFIWENVKGMFSSNARADFWAIIQAFANIGGYDIEWQLVNTAWLLPQNRERIYLIGHLTTSFRNWQSIFPIGETSFDITKLKKGSSANQTIGTIMACYGKTPTDGQYIEVIQVNPSKENGGKQPSQHNRVYSDKGLMVTIDTDSRKNVFLSEPRHKHGEERIYTDTAPTIQARYGTGGDNIPYVNSIRRLTEIECERLQGFPENWTQFGNYDDQIKPVPKTQRYKLIGNAVTATMVKLIGQRLIVNFRPATTLSDESSIVA